MLLILLTLTACLGEIETPAPVPKALEQLPVRRISMGCTEESRPNGFFHAFELPGLRPDDNSAPYGQTGRQLFQLPYCTEITIVDLAWSEYDKEYYVKVRLEDGQEGWITPRFFNIRE
jgi:hypothetical protein